jgi:hypothetical protein
MIMIESYDLKNHFSLEMYYPQNLRVNYSASRIWFGKENTLMAVMPIMTSTLLEPFSESISKSYNLLPSIRSCFKKKCKLMKGSKKVKFAKILISSFH